MLVSIDIGIKNMSYCLMDGSTIVDWNIINLCKKIFADLPKFLKILI